jgi:2-keto-4-pentenoate hydratase
MLTASRLRDIATQIQTAQVEVRQIEPFTSRIPEFDLQSAYAVAQLIHDDRVSTGAMPAGRKIGFTNSAMWDVYGVREPIWAYMYKHTVSYLALNAGNCSLAQFAEPMIEPEIAFHFSSAPPIGADVQALLGCIDWVANAFEIVHSHYPGWKFRPADAVANCALHGTLLLGEPVAIEQLVPDPVAVLESFSLELSCDGKMIEGGRGSNVLGNPLYALAHLIAVLSKQPKSLPIQAGEIVTTGTITTAKTVRPGESWQSTLQGIALPDLTVKFE